jgi:hypothetical protein
LQTDALHNVVSALVAFTDIGSKAQNLLAFLFAVVG